MLFKFLKNVIFIFCYYLSAWMVLNSEFCFSLQQLKLDELNKKGKPLFYWQSVICYKEDHHS